MKSTTIYIFWGIVFVLAGVGILSGIIDYEHLSQQARFWIFAIASAAFLLTYFLDGIRKWGWLFPASACAAIALSIGMDLGGRGNDSLTVAAILGSISLPFYVGFALDRKRWWLLIPAYILTFAMVIITTDALIARSVLKTGGVSQFLMAFSSGAGILFMLALPFFVAYFWSKKNWWALIPAGIFTSISLMSLLQFLDSYSEKNIGVFIGVMLLGFAATFAVLWLSRKTQPTDWAKYPAVVLFVAAALAFISGDGWSTLSTQEKAIAFAVASAVFFLVYFLSGIRKWGWLFPALGCAAFALMIGTSSDYPPVRHLFFVLLMASLALPFYVGFAVDRKRWGQLIPGGLLIPALILTYVTVFIWIADSELEDGIGMMFLFALPFFVLYFWSKKNWWAFIPAGVFASIGVVVALENLVPHTEYPRLPNTLSFDALSWVLLLGLAATFGVLWLRRKTQPTAWAAYPAAGFLAATVLFLILGEHFQEVWFPITLLITGGTFLLATFIKKLPAASQQLRDGRA
jgi:hypothetical protein